jgi:glutamate--cysteine ligase
MDDWELHLSSIFTEVRSYSYLEVRSADLLPGTLVLAVPSLWAGLLYDDAALDEALALGKRFDGLDAWRRGMDTAARHGLAGEIDGTPLAAMAAQALGIARRALRSEAGDRALARIAAHRGLEARR